MFFGRSLVGRLRHLWASEVKDHHVTDQPVLPPSSRVVDEDAWEDAGAEDTWDWVLTSLEDASPNEEADILEVHEDMAMEDENEAKRDEEFHTEEEASQMSQLPLAEPTPEEVSPEMNEIEVAEGKSQCQGTVNVLCAAVEEQHSDVSTAGIDFDEERSSFRGEMLRSKVESPPVAGNRTIQASLGIAAAPETSRRFSVAAPGPGRRVSSGMQVKGAEVAGPMAAQLKQDDAPGLPKRRNYGKAPGGVPSGSVDELATKLQKRFAKVEEEGLVLLKSQLPSQADARASSAEEAKVARMPKWGQSTAQLLYASKRHSWFDFEELDEEEQKAPG